VGIVILKKKLILMMANFLLILTHAEARVVSHVEVKWVGLYDDGRNDKAEEKQCKSFRPTKKQIIRFFSLSKQ
jgi:hypothetical protein